MIRNLTLPVKPLLLLAMLAFFRPVGAMAQPSNDGCGAYAGSTFMEFGPVCLVDGQAIISGIPNGDAVVPPGFTTAYLLSRTNGLILEQVGPTPNFAVTTVDVWRIHTLVFDPATFDPDTIQFGVTTGYDLAARFTQHGGPVCANISFTVPGSKSVECVKPCTAFAPQLSMDTTTICLANGQATLTAVANGAGVVPPGFGLRYLLTRTNGLIIEQSAPVPGFTVHSADVWRIHSLVYDPATLDPDTFSLESTSIYDFFPLLVQGGGSVCASISMHGDVAKTGDCQPPCTAAAGGLTPVQADLCLTDGIAVAQAIPDGTANIPGGHALTYLLSRGGLILGLGSGPQFTLLSPGQFRIHAFVYDPATFPISSVEAGTTTLGDIAAQLTQGGGDLCASLGMAGAVFQVADCLPACLADAGAMIGGDPATCLQGGVADLAAVSFGDTVVPPGFDMGYLLSEGTGMVLLAWAQEPHFTVDHPGVFRIHAFVRPEAFDMAQLTWGTTAILDLHGMLVQGGGPACASLDVLGAGFTVEDCTPACEGGVDTEITVCITDEPFALLSALEGAPCPGGTWTSPFAEVMDGMFFPASNAAGAYQYTVAGPDGTEYTATLTINVFECPGPDMAPATLHIWPNPAAGAGVLHVAFPSTPGQGVQVELIDATGRTVPWMLLRPAGTGEFSLDMHSLPEGLWTIRITDGGRVHTGRFVH